MIKGKAIIGIYGDYCAWQETSLTVEYLFGEGFYIEDGKFADYLCDDLGYKWEDLEKMDKVALDDIANKWFTDNIKEMNSGDWGDWAEHAVVFDKETNSIYMKT